MLLFMVGLLMFLLKEFNINSTYDKFIISFHFQFLHIYIVMMHLKHMLKTWR